MTLHSQLLRQCVLLCCRLLVVLVVIEPAVDAVV